MEFIRNIALTLLLCCCAHAVWSQAPDRELQLTLKNRDSLLFHAAFDTCDLNTMKSLFTEDFEFYHDKGGFTEGRDAFLNQISEGCSKRTAGDPPPTLRILVDDSLEVFPLYDQGKLYGAIQTGSHYFESLNGRGVYEKGDIAKFTHLWLLDDKVWKIRRELSYDHKSQ